MSIFEELNEVIRLHDEYASVRYEENMPTVLIDMFHDWHGKAATFFSRYLADEDKDLQKFKDIKHGNCYVLASYFGSIETSFCILIDKMKNSVFAKLEQLICEGEDIDSSISYVEPEPNTWRTYDVYTIKMGNEYHIWKNKCIRLLDLNFKHDGTINLFRDAVRKFEENHYAPKYMSDMIGILKACVEIPSFSLKKENTPIGETEEKTLPITINVSQNQSQSQNLAVDIFLEAVKDEIPGKYFKDLKAIAKEEPDPQKAKTKIIDKVKSFGNDVLSNIVANIITNPNVWSGMF